MTTAATMTSARPTLHALKTPSSGTLPSELPRSPYPGTPSLIKAEDGFKTPITPPTAYMDFLKAVSSPVSVSVDAVKSGKSTPTSAPSSDSSACSCQCEGRSSAKTSVPPSPPAPAQPQSAPATASLRRLLVPASPLSPTATESPISAFSIRSPFNVRSPLDWEVDANKRWSLEGAKSGVPRPVSVRQVVTRTVTYKPRMDLAPAPKGKKRRLE